MSDLKTATSAPPKVLYSNYLPASETALVTATTGIATKISSVTVINTDTVSQVASLSIVKTGGSAGASNRIMPALSLAAGAVLDLGQFWLGTGDFISGIAANASKIVVIVTGVEFSATTVGVAAGIQDDAIGTGGRTAASGSVNGTNTIGTGNNRYLLASLMCTQLGTATAWSTYDTLTMSCTDGAMTRLVSIDFTVSTSTTGSIHLFGRANPASSSTQTITANVVDAGVSFNLAMASMSVSGVASVNGATSTGPSSAAALSLPVTSASGNRPVFAASFLTAPQDFAATGSVARVRGFNGNASGFNAPNWMILADALGATTVTATAVSQFHAAVGLNLVPA